MGTQRFRWAVVAALTALAGCTLLVPLDEFTGGGAAAVDAGNDAASIPASDGGDAAASDAQADVVTGDCPSTDVSLVAWFKFDEGSGTMATDCSSRRLVAVSIGQDAPRWGQGRVGGAALFAVDTCFDVQGAEDLFSFEGKAFTVAAWVSVSDFATSTNTGRFIAAHKVVNGWHFGTDDPNRFELDLEFGDGGKLETSGSLPPNVWTHVAAVYEPGARTTFYVNGAVTETKTSVPARFDASATTPSLRIGCRSPGANHFRGLADDLRIYSRALANDEIANLAR